MFDITKFRSADTFIYNLKDPDGNQLKGEGNKPLGVELYAKGSAQFNEASERLSKAFARLKGKYKDFEKYPAEDVKKAKNDFMVGCTSNLVNFTYGDLSGEEAKAAFYADTQLGFMHEQIDAELGKWRLADGKN